MSVNSFLHIFTSVGFRRQGLCSVMYGSWTFAGDLRKCQQRGIQGPVIDNEAHDVGYYLSRQLDVEVYGVERAPLVIPRIHHISQIDCSNESRQTHLSREVQVLESSKSSDCKQ